MALLLYVAVGSTHAALLTFDEPVSGATSFSYDGDGDLIDDVIFSTIDPLGFNTLAPGLSQSFIDERGLEGTSVLAEDLRVDFLVGAVNNLSFGFVLGSNTEDDFVAFSVFDALDNLLVTATVTGTFSPSSFPEGLVDVSFSGIAAYATFDFTSDYGRYIIDNFEGTFGSTERPVPLPGTLLLMCAALLGSGVSRLSSLCKPL